MDDLYSSSSDIYAGKPIPMQLIINERFGCEWWLSEVRGILTAGSHKSQQNEKKKKQQKYSVYFTAITKGKHLAIHNNKLAFDAFVNKTTGVYSVDDTLPLPFDCGLIVCFMCVCVCVFHICLSTKWKSPVVFSLLFDYLM